jgi:hypothetical protein
MRQEFEAFQIVSALDDLKLHLGALAQAPQPGDELASVSAISPDETKSRELMLESFEYQLGAVAVLNVCRMNYRDQHQTHYIDEQMSFATIDLLAGVVAVSPPFSVVLTDWESMTAALG